ncbi:MAG: hypothetical protein A3B68_03235 [Candidatus Melainabacteria bacterium RIFCSPHIGHO2_02_FULL_34_12]|nr:MAG: hypothetical protein A3B68_03235 [Candidatus Melainabacteria bacterium RIFCSPHIGHO2_02_FULL_34_12]
MIDPLNNTKSSDEITRAPSVAASGSSEQQKGPPIESATSWFERQKAQVRFTSITAVVNFLNDFGYLNQTNPIPTADDLAQLMDFKYQAVYPVTVEQKTNTASEQYVQLRPKLSALQNQDIEIIYSSTLGQKFNSSKRIAVLIPDIHTNPDVRLTNYRLLKKLYTTDGLNLSSGFKEGPVNPSEVLNTMPTNISHNDLMQDLKKKKLDPEQVLLYEIREGVQLVNGKSIAFLPENLKVSEVISSHMKDLISIASGVYPSLFPVGHFESANHLLGLLYGTYKDFEKAGMEHEFYALLALSLRKNIDRIGYQDVGTSQRLFEKSVEVFTNFKKFSTFLEWQRYYQFIPPAIQPGEQYDRLRDYYTQVRFEDEIVRRNTRLLESFSIAEPGARPLIIGWSHLDTKACREDNLIKKLEANGIPVVVIGHKGFKSRITI